MQRGPGRISELLDAGASKNTTASAFLTTTDVQSKPNGKEKASLLIRFYKGDLGMESTDFPAQVINFLILFWLDRQTLLRTL